MSDVDETLNSLDALFALGQQALDTPRTVRASIASAVTRALDAQIDAALRAVPAEYLNDALPKGTRMGGLAQSRFRTVADVANSSAATLATVPGIGPQSAAAIHAEALAQQKRVRSETRFRLDPDSMSKADTEILRLLLRLRHAEPAVEQVRGPIASLKEQVDPLRMPAQRAGSRLARFFSGKGKRAEAQAALQQIIAIASDPGLADLRAQLLAIAHPPPSHDDPWTEYERDAATINALLSQFVAIGTVEEAQATHGFISRDLVNAADRVTLDRTHLRSFLRGYQAFGAQYLLSRRKAILGDEMGLGKTVQALAVAAHLATQDKRHVLVVCPASVVSNWMNETAKHTTLRPWQIHGSERDADLSEWARWGGVAITTFDTLKALTLTTTPSLLIVDEAHFIKNPATQRARAVMTVLDSCEWAVFLSGTPMENRVEEFKNLVSYVQPAVAGQIHVRDGLSGATGFRKIVAPVYLRRNQIDVLTELPELIEVEDWVLLGAKDASAYRSAVHSGNFMAMRQAAYAPAVRSGSAKLERMVEIVEEATENEAKVLVFSYFRGVLDIIRDSLPGKVFGPITGATATAERQRLVDEFTAHAGHAVLLSQIEAGGVGLNIQAASVVILAEPQWKPSTEAQAIARAHRMGQVRTVQVHRLLAKDSVDVMMRATLAKKSDLFDEYARRSHAKESDAGSVETGWESAAAPTEQDFVRAEQARLSR
ncbi:DEAD/DEAH box helicase [Rhodococcus sp. ARC_M6]|uniref:DEAD/DEAH box helicase n=1 Tax=Rhodococcus sp. ARC_M6 TaxID=2928852 RepID=UPI001FB32E72|nr:DEAD/DEAH box helicase [Rhodococcus sp. ARC_M6]